jgi:oxidase EvaA
VTKAHDGLPDWVIEEERLRNTRSDFFSIGAYLDTNGRRLTLMHQPEQALVMLLVAEIEGSPAVLLNLRTEPGLIGLTNLSTTVQSTPSNYLRRHGGKATPFIEYAADPSTHGEVLYEGEHHDWGEYYVQKTKRFLILRIPEPVEAPPGYCWVSQEICADLLLADHLITNDLRVGLSLLLTLGGSPDRATLPDTAALTPGSLTPTAFDLDHPDDRGTAVGFYRTDTETREVASWVQPLLVPNEAKRIRLVSTGQGANRRFALVSHSQPGLLGRALWFPADIRSGETARRVQTSAEGGRFWRFEIDIELVSAGTGSALMDAEAAPVTWVTGKELAALAATSVTTSLELRMAWSLVVGRQ